MKFPQSINRNNFDLIHFRSWKATEYRVFFLYMAVPLLKDELMPKYFWNLCSIVFAIRILHFVTDKTQIKTAQKLLNCFAESYYQLYGGDTCLTFTFHCVVKHLVDDVIKHGSLCGHSMFSLENSLGFFKKTLNGTRGFSNQFIKSKHILYLSI